MNRHLADVKAIAVLDAFKQQAIDSSWKRQSTPGSTFDQQFATPQQVENKRRENTEK